MLAFDLGNPYPLLPDDSYTYREAQAHAVAVDAWLELNTEQIERNLMSAAKNGIPNNHDQELWIGLPVQTLMTPYVELRSVLDKLALSPGQLVVDLGAAYGRMALIVGRHFPQNSFLGYEYVGLRVQEGRRALDRFHYSNVQLECADVCDPEFHIPSAPYYFLYDFGSRSAIESALQRLKRIALEQPITIVGRGRRSRDLIEQQHPWLSQVAPPRHFAHYSIYRSA